MATFSPDTKNEMFQLAVQLVNQSNRNVFLTGKAGTGKTTFLKYIRENCHKQLAIVAPTGVAAINAGGVTIHSFFNLPLSPFIPDVGGQGFSENNSTINRNSLLSHLRFNSEKKKLFQELELLVIDEISMVRCDTLDAVDTVLRFIRKKPLEKFGGIQMLFIGDMLQLPPVIKEQEWNILSDYYGSQYFFDSKVLQEDPPVYIEFNKIYRQSDERFINLLNQVRNNELNEGGLKILESRFQPVFRRRKNDGYIILTTHNEKAREINTKELRETSSTLFTYQAEVKGDFSERAYPADEVLYLKTGAQVMFIKNDSAENGKRFFNGKIGTVSKLEEDRIFVKCDGEDEEIDVFKEEWENIRYTVNKSTRQIDSEVLGSFIQYPLRLAWAITIHKSQGLTFEKAIIDAGKAFAPGQVYVALSRCTSLEGMVLLSQISTSSMFIDQKIIEFSRKNLTVSKLLEELSASKKNYELIVLQSTFDYSTTINTGKDLFEYLLEHNSSFNPETFPWIEELIKKLELLQETAKKFQAQLKNLFFESGLSNTENILQQRIKAASDYFIKETEIIISLLNQSPVITDSRLHAKEFNESAKEIFGIIAKKKHILKGIAERFDLEIYHKLIQQFSMPSFIINAYAGASQKRIESPHPVLHQQLRKLRDNICSKKDLPIYIVAGSNTLDEMARYLPQSLTELRKISGFGDAKVSQYGQQFLDIINAYCEENKLSSLIKEKKPKREKKSDKVEKKTKVDTKEESYKLYKSGKSISEIARERNLTLQTIEGHLTHFVQLGKIPISEIMSREKIVLIEPVVKNYHGGSLTPMKEKLGSSISFGEIRLVIASVEFQKKSSSHEDH